MIYGSVCSGIEAATVAWHPLGWQPAFFSEIDRFPRAVLGHHYPEVPLHGDFTTIEADEYGRVDLLVGGTPCQSFSVAGKRLGLDDPRGNLAIEYARLARRLRARWIVWENVPGVLSSNGGRDFGAFLRILGECGYGWAYRVLDAQYVRVDGFASAVPQRRQRVILVGYLGNWRRAAAVLFEREGLRGDPPPRREAKESLASGLTSRIDFESETFVAHALTGEGFDASEAGTGRGTPLVPVPLYAHGQEGSNGAGIGAPGDPAFALDTAGSQVVAFDTTQITSKANRSNPQPGGPCHPLAAGAHPPAIAFQSSQSGVRLGEAHATLDANNDARRHNGVLDGMAVRRLTPRECERLQGFSDDYTAIPYRGKPAADGPRYKALGNSMAVNVMRWVGRWIALVDAIGDDSP